MAVSSRVIFFLSVLVVSSIQTHARESHFFSKVPRESPQDKNPSFVPVEANKKQQENQDPSFVPQSGNGYGLYGHETSYNNKAQDHFNNNNNNKYEENVTYEPYTTPSLSQTEERSDNHDKDPKNSENYNYNYDNENKYYNNNNNEYKYNYNANAYEEDQKEPQRFRNRGYNTYNNNNNNNNNMAERQGMSDTRFMEQGKYYYDVIDEKNHGQYYAKHGRHGQNNLNEGGRFYDNNNENSFRDPYDSRWEKNMMNNNEQQEFGEEQQDQFMP